MTIELNFSELKMTYKNVSLFLKKNKKIFLTYIASGMTLAIFISLVVFNRQYESSVRLLVNETYTSEKTEKNTNLAWIEAYKDIIFSDNVLENTLNKTNSSYSVEELRNNINLKTEGNSVVFKLTVRANTVEDSILLIESLVNVFSDEMTSLDNVSDVKMISQIEQNNKAVKPRLGLNLFLGAFLGFILSIVFIFISENDYFESIKKVVGK